MTNSGQSSRGFWLGVLILLLAGIFLGFRAERAVTAVLSARGASQSDHSTNVSIGSRLLVKTTARDSLRTTMGPSRRNPFGNPPSGVRRQQTRDVEEIAPPEVPTVRLLMYAEDSPLVVLDVGGAQSNRLHVGESFRGWTVVDIQAKTVTVTKDDEVLVLSSP